MGRKGPGADSWWRCVDAVSSDYGLSLTSLARGPFGLASTSNVTFSPPLSESKLSTASRWKKYSFPSSAAMKPKPRSETSFLMVPLVIADSSSRTSPEQVTDLFEVDAVGHRKRASHGGMTTRSLAPGLTESNITAGYRDL